MSYHLRKKKCGNWRQGDKDLPKVFLLESHKGGDRTLFPFFSFNAFFSTLYSGTPVPPLSTGLPKVVNQMTYINANQCLPCFNTCRNFKCWDHTPPGGNLPKLQVPLGIGDLSLVFLCFYWLLFLLFFCGFLFFCLFCKYQCFFVSLGFFFYTLSLVLVEFIYSCLSFKHCLYADDPQVFISNKNLSLEPQPGPPYTFGQCGPCSSMGGQSHCSPWDWHPLVCRRTSLGIANMTWPKQNLLLPLWKWFFLLPSHIKGWFFYSFLTVGSSLPDHHPICSITKSYGF